MKSEYAPPKVLKRWLIDIDGGSRYELMIMDNQMIHSASGRYAMDSGCYSVSLESFHKGEMHTHIASVFGEKVLEEACDFVQSNDML